MAESDGEPKTHNMIGMNVFRAEGDPLMCPYVSTAFLLGAKPGALAGSQPQIVVHAVPVACVGAVCALWDKGAKACSHSAESRKRVAAESST